MKFSTITVSSSYFYQNWVTAGGIQYSIGGAIACFYEYVSGDPSSIVIENSEFISNMAFGVISSPTGPSLRAGQGGAISIIGITIHPVVLRNITFTGNIADSDPAQIIVSLGGALTVSQASITEVHDSTFTNNFASGGFGDDVATPTNDNDIVTIGFYDCEFYPISNTTTLKDLKDTKEQLILNIFELIYSTSLSKSLHTVSVYDQFEDAEQNQQDLISTVIGIVATSAHIRFENKNNFYSSYHILLGNVMNFLSTDDVENSDLGSKLELNGPIPDNMLMITSIASNINIYYSISLARLNSVNGTLNIAGNITVEQKCILTGSTFSKGLKVGNDEVPKIIFQGDVIHGSFDYQSINNNNNPFQLRKRSTYSPNLVFSGLDVTINGTMYITNISTAKIMQINLKSGSSLAIGSFGNIKAFASTIIEGDEDLSFNGCKVVNNGVISLININNIMTTFGVNHCDFIQADSGIINVTLTTAYQDTNIILLESDRALSGTLEALLSTNPDSYITLYPPDYPSTFNIFAFKSVEVFNSSSTIKLNILSNNGIAYQDSIQSNSYNFRNSSDYSYNYSKILTVSEMACETIADKYFIDPVIYSDTSSRGNYICHVCLMNSSCNYCQGDFTCAQDGFCKSGDVFDKNCCIDNCNDRGKCEASSNFNSFSCKCDFLYDGDSCQDLSLYSYLFIGLGVFIFCFIVLSLRYYYYYRRQPDKVLEDLLHQLSGDKSGKEIVSASHLQRLQQEFILKDVFVKYSEIKIEEQIGEGSFGVVFKASFRGAQVIFLHPLFPHHRVPPTQSIPTQPNPSHPIPVKFIIFMILC